jgi:SAM-dependent methyltransferase
MTPLNIKQLIIGKMLSSFDDGEKYMNSEILDYIKKSNKKPLKILDVGVGSGEIALKITEGASNIELYGIDALPDCKVKSVKFKQCDIDKEKFPYKEDTFDIVYSNQLIEHILDKDKCLEECNRVLKKNGLFLTATENIASLDNIFSLILGQEPLVQLGGGTKRRINSILSPNFGEDLTKGYDHRYGHKNVLSYYSLKRHAEINGFSGIEIKSFGNIWLLEKLLPMYNRVIVVKATKS